MSGRYLLRLPLGGFSVDVHVACDGRISLYPAAPFRLATLLHAWTIAQVGRGSSLKRQTGWVKSANPHNSHTSDPPNAPKERRNYRWLTPTSGVTGWRAWRLAARGPVQGSATARSPICAHRAINHCGSGKVLTEPPYHPHKPTTWRCADCRGQFSVYPEQKGPDDRPAICGSLPDRVGADVAGPPGAVRQGAGHEDDPEMGSDRAAHAIED